MSVATKRVYEPASPQDGLRYLVDRLWPRGISKDAAHLAAWLRDLAPSDELRRNYHHDSGRFEEFERRYRAELEAHVPELERLVDQARVSRVTLVFASRDAERSNATVLRDVIQERLDAGSGSGATKTRRPRPRTT